MERRLGRSLGLVLFGVFLALVCIELILQAGALYTKATGRQNPAAWLTDRQRVLCVGDSNVYGVWMKRDQTYPHFLEEIWNTAAPAEPAEVLNLGVPGMNSSKLRKNFPDLMDVFRPDLVIVVVGANDISSVPVPIEEDVSLTRRLEHLAWRTSRLFRLVYMLAAGLHREQFEVDLKDGPAKNAVVRAGDREFNMAATESLPPGGWAGWPAALQDNIVAMAGAASVIGAKFVVATYASDRSLYGSANHIIRGLLDRLEMIDAGAPFRRLCPDERCNALFLRDQHPNAAGYQLYAAILWHALRERRLAAPGGDESAGFASLNEEVKTYLRQLGYVKPAAQ